MKPNTVKQALREGRVQLGTGFWQLRSQDALRTLAAAGFDWAFIDTEHGNFSIETIQDLARIAVRTGISPIIRVAELQYSLVARALDCGAEGIIFPRVEEPALLEKAVSWTKFPPMGVRGCGIGAFNYDFEPVSIPQIIEHSNAHSMVVLQIETKRAFEACDELLSVPNIDAVMVGPVDLSISLGIPGQFDHPRLIATIEQVADCCRRHGIAPGIQNRDLKMAKFWRDHGMLFLGCSNETTMLYDRAREITSALR